jgi:hypothetical protein
LKNYWHCNCNFCDTSDYCVFSYVFKKTNSRFHNHCCKPIGVFMFKRYFLMTIAMLVVAVAFVPFADSQTGPPPPPNQIQFDPPPPLTAQVGVPYVYTAHLDGVDSAQAAIRYGVDRLDPPGFSIDSASGVVSWTPAARGWYSLSLAAEVRYKTHALAMLVEQHFLVAVAGGNGVVQGKVTDTLNAGIPNVIVEALQSQLVGWRLLLVCGKNG